MYFQLNPVNKSALFSLYHSYLSFPFFCITLIWTPTSSCLQDHYWHRPALNLFFVFFPSPTYLLEHSPKNSIDSTYSWPHHPVCFTPSLGLSQTELELNFVFATKQQGEHLIACFSSAKYMNEVIQVNNAQQIEAQWSLAIFPHLTLLWVAHCLPKYHLFQDRSCRCVILHLRKFLKCL